MTKRTSLALLASPTWLVNPTIDLSYHCSRGPVRRQNDAVAISGTGTADESRRAGKRLCVLEKGGGLWQSAACVNVTHS
ncbi:MAG: hypothetical protein RLZZ450_5206 [Pseudomonadota bacterium]|jgi:hypothetical protein